MFSEQLYQVATAVQPTTKKECASQINAMVALGIDHLSSVIGEDYSVGEVQASVEWVDAQWLLVARRMEQAGLKPYWMAHTFYKIFYASIEKEERSNGAE